MRATQPLLNTRLPFEKAKRPGKAPARRQCSRMNVLRKVFGSFMPDDDTHTHSVVDGGDEGAEGDASLNEHSPPFSPVGDGTPVGDTDQHSGVSSAPGTTR